MSTAINGLGEGTSAAQRNDYAVVQYAGGGTTTTTYHRRKLSNIFAALNKSDITTALGYTPPTSDTNTHRSIQMNGTEILGNNTTALNLKAGTNITLSNASGTVTINGPTIPTINLNGSSTTSATFYAPTTVGTSGYYLKSSGSGAPTWASFPSIPSGNILYGTSTPSSSTGANGDIYCVYS